MGCITRAVSGSASEEAGCTTGAVLSLLLGGMRYSSCWRKSFLGP